MKNTLLTTSLLSALLLAGCTAKSESTTETEEAPKETETSMASPVNLEGTITRSFAITGMTCGGCAASVEQGVAKVPGVVKCDVDWEAGTATINLASAEAEPAVVAAITELGFGAEVKAN